MKIHVCEECWNVFGRLDAPWNDTPQNCPICQNDKFCDPIEIQAVDKENENIDTAFYRLVVSQRDLAWKQITHLQLQVDKEHLEKTDLKKEITRLTKTHQEVHRKWIKTTEERDELEDQLNFQMDPLDPGSLAHENLMLRGALGELLGAEKEWFNQKNGRNEDQAAEAWGQAIEKAEKILDGT